MEPTNGYRPQYPTARDSTAGLIQRFNEHKLETEFFDGYLVHKTSEWKHLSSSRSWETSTWRSKGAIGSGGFGTVWLEEKEGGKEKQLRAVKMLSRNCLPEASRSQELLALVKLSGYDYLFVKFLGWFEDPNHTFLAMEYIENGDLSEYIKTPSSRADAKEITRQILEGLVVLHGKEICHRDLKPQNILMASLDPIWVKIADFGISKQVKGTAARTQIGTPGYTAPEMLGVVPREFIKQGFIPYALDIWSLGALVHELFASEIPFLEPLDDLGGITGLSMELPSDRGVDFSSLVRYCHGDIKFPTDVLQKAQLDEDGIAFIKSLLVANPKDRPTAICALQFLWLTEGAYTSDWVKKLKSEFSCLGMDLDLDLSGKENQLMRQVGREDIMRFLPSLAKTRVPSLALDAITKGCGLALSRLLESPDYGLESIDSSTRGKLFQLAVETRQPGMIEILLQKRADIGAYINNQTVLQWAVRLGDVNTATLLLENTNEDTNCYNLLLQAIRSGDVNMIKVFLGGVVNINAFIGDGRTILQAAAEGGYIDIVKLLLRKKADVNAKAAVSGGRTALQAAVGGGYIDIVKLLLDNKADVNAPAARDKGRTALQAAAEGGHIDVVKLLLDNKADVNAKAAVSDGRTALQAAAEGGHIDVVKLLLDNKADVNAPAAEYKGRTALQAAAEGGHIDVVKLLLDNKADVNAPAERDKGRTALQAAAEGGHIDVVKLLLDNKADANAPAGRYNGRTALRAAAEGGHTDIVNLLSEVLAKANVGASLVV